MMMARYSINPVGMLDRPWRCGHPFRPHRGRLRKWLMSILFAVLTLIISAYSYLTDSDRVRLMSQGYLSQLIGGRVEIGHATLSIFQGLRVDDVHVYVDRRADKPDSLLFSAQAFVLNYDPRKLIAGKLESTEIVAQKPHVYLTFTETGRGDRWNFDRLHKAETPAPPGHPGVPTMIPLPSVLLRNAVVEISQVKAGSRCPVGSMAVEGQIAPIGNGKGYQFGLQSRGVSLGPDASGTISSQTGQVVARLHNVQFGDDLRSMFPADLRDWWERHELAGRIKSIDVSYMPPHANSGQQFSITTTVEGVTLAVHREEWSGREELERWQRTQGVIALLAEPYRIAGFTVHGSAENVGLRVQSSHTTASALPARLEPQTPDPVPHSPIDAMTAIVDPSPFRLRDVSGRFVFTEAGIDVPHLWVKVGAGDPKNPARTNSFHIRGHMDGYQPESPLQLEISSDDPNGLFFPARPKFLDALPPDARQIWGDLRPEGHCNVSVTVDRPVPGAVPQINGLLEVVNATFLFHQFPYPFRNASGKIAFGRDPFSGKNYITIMNMRGRGILGGPNEHGLVTINGRVGPIGPETPEPGFKLHATGANICSEPTLMAAMPREVHDALKLFDAAGKGQYPQFRANFACDIDREPGHAKRWHFNVDIGLLDAAGRMIDFPYPCDHVYGNLTVHEDYVEIKHVVVPGANGQGEAVVTGLVRWNDETGHGKPLDMNVKVDVHGMSIDQNLLAAIPIEERDWMKKLGIGGKLDVSGRVFTVLPPDWRAHIIPGRKPIDPPVLYDLGIAIRDGTIWPADGLFSISAVSGKLHLTHDQLEILALHGRRDKGEIAADGRFTFAGPHPRMALHVSARNITMDRPLYAMLPPEGRAAWDEVQPSGTGDAEIDYHGLIGAETPTAIASVSQQIELPPREPEGFHAVLRPRNLSVKVKTAPYPLTFTAGTVTISPGKAVLKDLSGRHGSARLIVSGEGSLGAAPVWELALRGQNFPCDQELRRAMPPTLLGIVDGLKLHGLLGFDFPKFSYRGSGSAADPDIDVTGALTLKNGSIEAGLPLTAIQGGLAFAAATRQGKVDRISGQMTLNSLNFGGRPLRDMKLDLLLPSGGNELQIDKIQARIAGGELGGNAAITFPEQGANRYLMNLILRNADVRALTGEAEQDIRGELTASLALEGAWGDPRARRGRGDVVVAGKQLYRMPLMLGLLQVTNLSLPIGGPFTKGSAHYSVEGTRVNFEQISMRSDIMMMTGTGYLDFNTRQVRMSLSTDNPAGLRVPFISDLWQGARQELLKINVRGTVQEPKVEPTTLGIFTTTVDQVFRGDGAKG